MFRRLFSGVSARASAAFPEQRVFLRSDDATRFVRLSSVSQIGLLAGGAILVGWTVVATASLMVHGLVAGSSRDEAVRAQQVFEDRLAALSTERDLRVAEADAALTRFDAALDELSKMQGLLLASEEEVRELTIGMEVVQGTLAGLVAERDAARSDAAGLRVRLADAPAAAAAAMAARAEAEATLDALAGALGVAAEERDGAVAAADEAVVAAERMERLAERSAERNDRIFSRLEEAVETSLEPLEKVFERSGVSPDAVLREVRGRYEGQGGPLEPVAVSTRGDATALIHPDTARANAILGKLEEVDLHRIVAESLPLAHPVRGAYRRTSGFGPRWGRMHSGLDFAGAQGTPIHTTAAGTVVFAGRQSGYGNIVKVRHAFGFETRYAHLHRIRVRNGQKVSRGERIGDMGTTGRSTGVHLHYEVRRHGSALNPSNFISAGRDVF